MKTRIIRNTTYASKEPEITLRNIWGREEMWNFDPITSESRNWSNEELQGREVHAKESHKDNSLSEKTAKKFMKQAIASCIRKKFKQLIADVYMKFHGVFVQTLSRNWKYYFVMNRNSDSKLHTQAHRESDDEDASGNQEELTRSSDDWWSANKWTKSWWETPKKHKRSPKVFSQRWSWSDFLTFLAVGVVPTGVRTHAVATTVCATGSVHTLTCCKHIFLQHWHCAYTSHILKRVTHIHGSRVSALHMCHTSPSRLLPSDDSPVFAPAVPWRSFRDHSRQRLRRPHWLWRPRRPAHEDELFGYLPGHGRRNTRTVPDYTDLFSVTLHDDNVQEFDTKWDQVLLSMSKIIRWYPGKSVQVEDTWVWSTQYRIRIVRHGDSSEGIGSQPTKVENHGAEETRPENFDYETSTPGMGELHQEQW